MRSAVMKRLSTLALQNNNNNNYYYSGKLQRNLQGLRSFMTIIKFKYRNVQSQAVDEV